MGDHRKLNKQKDSRPKKKQKRRSRLSAFLRFVLLMMFVFFAGFFTFYAIDNNLFSRKSEEPFAESAVVAQDQNIGPDLSGEPALAGEDEPFFSRLLSMAKKRLTGENEEDEYPKNLQMDFYFATLGQDYVLGSEERTIAAGSPQNAAANAINELLKGPYFAFHFAVIPPGTTLVGIDIYENFIRVDLSSEFLLKSLDNRILDGLIIYSIVNTLTQIPQVDGVLFMIESKAIKEYGNVDLSVPLIKNEAYIAGPEEALP
jgi:hypothetical protein